MHRLEQEQCIPISIGEAWDFFSSPHNLSKITPPEMGFIIHSGAEEKIYAGQVIRYTVKPLAGIPTTWVTEITQVNEPHYFIDTQLVGPYSQWHHQHFFEAIAGGVRLRDIVHYQVPLGPVGDLLNSLLIRKRVEGIFEYRHQALLEMFGELKATPTAV